MSLLSGWAAALLGKGEGADGVPRKRERLGARLDHGLGLQVEERADAAQAVWPPCKRGKEAAWVDGFCCC
jgi:hypothetical protein